MDLLCDRIGLPKTTLTYRNMSRLQWRFGQKYTLPPNIHFWSTDTQYSCPTSENICRRRDKFLIRGTEKVNVTLPNAAVAATPTALCCDSVCFISITGVHTISRVKGRMSLCIVVWGLAHLCLRWCAIILISLCILSFYVHRRHTVGFSVGTLVWSSPGCLGPRQYVSTTVSWTPSRNTLFVEVRNHPPPTSGYDRPRWFTESVF